MKAVSEAKRSQATLAELLEKGISPSHRSELSASGTADAIRHLEKGHACGKIVVEI